MAVCKDNKKIIHATPLDYDGISFKSKLEKMCYMVLKEAGLPVQYEPQKFVIWQGFKPTIPFYDKCKVTRLLNIQTKKLLDITYTPDFLFEYKGHLVIIEAKGFPNETFTIKKKLFRGWLEKNRPDSLYFEVYTKRHLLQAIDIIKNLKDD